MSLTSFGRYPKELQIDIWDFAIMDTSIMNEASRLIKVSHDEAKGLVIDKPTSSLALLRVCYLSRERTLKYAVKPKLQDGLPGQQYFAVPINPERDRVHIHFKNLRYLDTSSPIKHLILHGIRHGDAFPTPLDSNIFNVLLDFPNLVTIEMVPDREYANASPLLWPGTVRKYGEQERNLDLSPEDQNKLQIWIDKSESQYKLWQLLDLRLVFRLCRSMHDLNTSIAS